MTLEKSLAVSISKQEGLHPRTNQRMAKVLLVCDTKMKTYGGTEQE